MTRPFPPPLHRSADELKRKINPLVNRPASGARRLAPRQPQCPLGGGPLAGGNSATATLFSGES
jgi:hypothetical protein